MRIQTFGFLRQQNYKRRRGFILQLCCFAGMVGVSQISCYAQTVNTFDVLVATANLTVVGTATVQGNAFSIGGSSFVVNQGNVGIGTSTPSFLFHIVGVPITGSGAQFQWISSSASLRAGEVSGGAWNPANIGLYSVAFGLDNQASGEYSSISGGQSNTAEGTYSIIGGGSENSIDIYEVGAVIGGGQNNQMNCGPDCNGGTSVIGGGYNNSISNGGADTIAGGSSNGIVGLYSSIGGGANNSAVSDSVVAGGENNTCSGVYSVIGGGFGNIANSGSILGGAYNHATGNYSAIPGGYENTASGRFSFAAGQQSSATAQGAFVWADSQNSPFVSSNNDEFKIRAGGGFVFYSTPTAPTVIVSSGALMISTSAMAATAVPNIFISSVNGNVGIGTANPATVLDVNGSAQFGSSATKSTFTATGLLKLTASGIQWADGSTSTTAASSGGGSWNGGAVSNPATFTATVNISTLIVTGVYGLPTRQVFTSTGSGVYYSTASTGVMPRQLRIRMVGGGGGGGGDTTGTGVQGSSTVFNSVYAAGGYGGAGGELASGAGGSGGTGLASFRSAGGAGGVDSQNGAQGGSSALGGGAPSTAIETNIGGTSALPNTGGGGGGAARASDGFGSGGGGGEYVEMIINSPTTFYSFTVGSGGNGGAGSAYNGGKGGSGVIIVDEYY